MPSLAWVLMGISPDEWRQALTARASESWYCDQCHVEVYERRCQHCGKTKREAR